MCLKRFPSTISSFFQMTYQTITQLTSFERILHRYEVMQASGNNPIESVDGCSVITATEVKRAVPKTDSLRNWKPADDVFLHQLVPHKGKQTTGDKSTGQRGVAWRHGGHLALCNAESEIGVSSFH